MSGVSLSKKHRRLKYDLLAGLRVVREVKERPILFSAPMVRAILEGRKTQTRRVVTSKQVPILNGARRVLGPYSDGGFDFILSDETGSIYKCPYGQPGDRLWVRETWGEDYTCSDVVGNPQQLAPMASVVYRADGHSMSEAGTGWCPCIHMPRYASRIRLEVVSVRVERLQGISDADCEAEGVRPSVDGNGQDWRADETGWRRTFRQLWDSINAKKAPWDSNPWVWVIEFKQENTCSKPS